MKQLTYNLGVLVLPEDSCLHASSKGSVVRGLCPTPTLALERLKR